MIERNLAHVEPDEYETFERQGVISNSTRIAAALMLAALLVGSTLDYLASAGPLKEFQDLTLAALTLVPVAMAALILTVAKSFSPGAIRTEWTLFGLGMLSIGVGNVVFIVLYLVTGKDPYPSVADIFTLAGYALFAAAFAKAIRAYRGLLGIRQSIVIASGIAVAALALVYFTVIGPYVVFAPDESQSLAMRVFNTLYPVLDMLVLILPAVALGLLVSKLGSGRVAWPWWFVVLSSGFLAVTDTIFAYMTYTGAGRTVLIDAGYALAPMLLGMAVLVARDVYQT